SSFEKWREEILLGEASPYVFADLGYGVLDTAMVETAAYCLAKTSTTNTAPFFRLVHAADKSANLASAVTALNSADTSANVFAVHPSSFRKVPGSPFIYWVSNRVLKLFSSLPDFLS